MLDGRDPRVEGGGVAVGAQTVSELLVDRTLNVTARVRSNEGEWSPLVQVTLVPIIDPNAPVIEPARDLQTVRGFGVRHRLVAADPNGDSLSFSAVPLPPGITLDPGTGIFSGVATSVGEWTVVATVSDGALTTSIAFPWVVDGHDQALEVPVVLNEYNAVRSSELLADGSIDPAFGAVAGNGGDWIELLVTQDNVDLRGWSLELWDREDGPLELQDTIVFTNNDTLSNLASGTIITIAESHAEDPSYNPRELDWNLHIRSATGFDSAFVTADAGNFDSNRHSFRVRVFDADGASRSPFMGETDDWRSFNNVGGDEVFARCDTPTVGVDPVDGDNRDTNASSFGELNNCGDAQQSGVDVREGFRGDPDCDGKLTVVDALLIARYQVGVAAPAASCDTWDIGQAEVVAADFNDDGAPGIVDALLLTQCVVGIENSYCHAG